MQRRTKSSGIASRETTSACASARIRMTTNSPKIFFLRNLHPVETGGSDVSGSLWAVNGVGNFWDDGFELDLDRDGIIDLPHRELDFFGILRRDFPAIAFLSDSPAVKLLRFANERAALPGTSQLKTRALTHFAFWRMRAQRSAAAIFDNE